MNSRGRPAAFLLLVVAAHVLLMWALGQLAPGSTPRTVIVEATPLQLRPLRPTDRSRDSSLPSLRTVAPALPASPWVPLPTLPQTLPLAITVEPAQPPAPQPSASAPRPRALDLTLPPASQRLPSARRQALDDPRANSKPQTLESRIAAAAGADLPLTVEDLGEGRKRYRKGRACVEVHDARIATLDPFNQSVSPTPKGVRLCD